jgi:hypothetical protein
LRELKGRPVLRKADFTLACSQFNFCLVPESGSSATLYAAVAILVGCTLKKLSSVWILVAGTRLYALASENASRPDEFMKQSEGE